METILPTKTQDHAPMELDGLIDSVKEVCQFRAFLNSESDRGCALMAASYLEDRVRGILRGVYIDDAHLVESSLKHMSFADTSNQAYLLGLLPKKMKRDLDIIRKIRNDFAHTAYAVNFTTGSIADRCLSLHYASRSSKEIRDSRSAFTSAALSIALCLLNGTLTARHALAPQDVDFGKESAASQLAPLLIREACESLKEDAHERGDGLQATHWEHILQALEMLSERRC